MSGFSTVLLTYIFPTIGCVLAFLAFGSSLVAVLRVRRVKRLGVCRNKALSTGSLHADPAQHAELVATPGHARHLEYQSQHKIALCAGAESNPIHRYTRTDKWAGHLWFHHQELVHFHGKCAWPDHRALAYTLDHCPCHTKGTQPCSPWL